MRPSAFHANGLRSLAGNFQERGLKLLETRGEIRKDLRRNFSFAPLGPENACDGQELPGCVLCQCLSRPARRFRPHVRRKAPYSRISSVKRFLSFMPAALRMVRTERAVRPCFPITFPKSEGCTRNSKTVTCSPSTARTETSSGLSTSALAMASINSLIWPSRALELTFQGSREPVSIRTHNRNSCGRRNGHRGRPYHLGRWRWCWRRRWKLLQETLYRF